MTILKIAKMGHPVLRTPAEPIKPAEISSTEVQTLIEHMIATMEDYDGIGLAAPQIHVSKQLFVAEVPQSRKSDIQELPLTVMINPEVTPDKEDKVLVWEGCLSIPGIRGLVPRYNQITVAYLDHKGQKKTLKASGFLAAVIQHETDHLNGTLFLDRMDSKAPLSFTDEWMKYWGEVQDVQAGTVTFL